PRAAVRAPGHADGERRVREAQPLELALELRDHVGEGPLRFGEGEAAGRERRTGHGPAPHRGQRSLPEDAVVGQHALHQRAPPVRDVGEQHVLLRSEAHPGAERPDDAGEPTAQPPLRAVLDAAVLDEHAVERASVRLLVPSNVVLDVLDLYGRGWRERTAQLPLYLVAEPVETPLV